MKGTKHKNIVNRSHNKFLNDLPSFEISLIIGIKTSMKRINAKGRRMYDNTIIDFIILLIVS
jgi:hypothetical protein